MTAMPAPYRLYDLHGRPRYIAAGDYAALLPDMRQKHGTGGWWEKHWLKIQKLYPRHNITDRASLQHWSSLCAAIAGPVTGALLRQTAADGPTQFAGGLATDDRRFFVKAYRHEDDALLARRQSEFVHHYFHNAFTIVPVLSTHDRIVLSPLLSRSGKDIAADDIFARLSDLGMRHREQFAQALKPALDYAHLNLPHLLQRAGHAGLWQAARELLANSPALPMVPVHGNVTPHSLFLSDRLSPVLLDYERAGWHVPFYDWWHVQCQPRVERGHRPDWRGLRDALHRRTQIDAATLDLGLLLYLLDQLAYDLQGAQDHPSERDRLEKTASLRIALTAELLDGLRQTPRG